MKSLVQKIKDAFTEMRDDIVVIHSEKGIEPFKKPLLMAAPALLILYGAVYGPSSSRLQEKQIEAEHLEAVSVHYSEYNDMQSRKAELRRKMPLAKDKGEWLSYILTSTSKSQGITFDALTAQEEQNAGPLLLVSRGASVVSTYNQIGLWLAEIENSKIFLKVTELQLSRSTGNRDLIRATIKLSTVFPKEAAQGEEI
ncbi:MAG: type 4a pilus biogenesis protein PilO [Elusimicrobiales bacterium]|nr:type 4a pilus biogenesis protein PilO [Elusimicrobiales bacterium]